MISGAPSHVLVYTAPSAMSVQHSWLRLHMLEQGSTIVWKTAGGGQQVDLYHICSCTSYGIRPECTFYVGPTLGLLAEGAAWCWGWRWRHLLTCGCWNWAHCNGPCQRTKKHVRAAPRWGLRRSANSTKGALRSEVITNHSPCASCWLFSLYDSIASTENGIPDRISRSLVVYSAELMVVEGFLQDFQIASAAVGSYYLVISAWFVAKLALQGA